MNLKPQKIINCYDSHVHWLATGQNTQRLSLAKLTKPEDVTQLKIKEQHFQGSWLIGFGWDQNQWPGQEYPHRKILDEVFDDFPIAFSRSDGHALWCNSKALQLAGFLKENNQLISPIEPVKGGLIVTDSSGLPTGVLVDLAMDRVKNLIPSLEAQQVKHHLLVGAQEFNRAGFTHIRDLTCSETQWNESIKLDESGQLNLAIEQFFCAEDPATFDEALKLANYAKKHSSPNLRAVGIKIYYDGALGSEGALISQDYASGSGRGLELLTQQELFELIKRAWVNNFEIAIHAIGDEAAHRVTMAAKKVVDSGTQGKLHIEHAQMLRPETIAILKNLNVTCHIQPCHWLSDRRWLKQKLGDLHSYVFPWKALGENQIPYFFGSDSPIERPWMQDNLSAVLQSPETGVPGMSSDFYQHHSHPDTDWTPNSYSQWNASGELEQLVFRGRSTNSIK